MFGLKEIVYGYIIGCANVIPGVSGGTFALILGILERLMHVINTVSFTKVKELFSGIKSGTLKSRMEFFHNFCKKKRLLFPYENYWWRCFGIRHSGRSYDLLSRKPFFRNLWIVLRNDSSFCNYSF